MNPKSPKTYITISIIIVGLLAIWFASSGGTSEPATNRELDSQTIETTEPKIEETAKEETTQTTEKTPPEREETTKTSPENYAYGNATITTDDSYRYIDSNGLPEHETGPFPTRGNPNAIQEQEHSYRVPLDPIKTQTKTDVRIAGVALNGVPFEPNTAETYDANDDWAIEAFDANGVGGLGIDWSNAHVQPNGTYHYHAVPEGMLEAALADQSGELILMGWAGDGFPMYYSQSNLYQSSWKVREGSRPEGAPEGDYDGTYTQDFEFVEGAGSLDECNGVMVEGEYIYIITDSFPYVGRCAYGTPDPSFDRKQQDNRGLPGTLNHNIEPAQQRRNQ